MGGSNKNQGWETNPNPIISNEISNELKLNHNSSIHAANNTCSPPQQQLCHNINRSPTQPQLHYNTNFTAIADTRASHHYFHSRSPYTAFNNDEPPTHVTVANGDIVTSIGKAKVPLPQLPPGTDDCFIMDSFPNNFLSMGQFCDSDSTVTFTKTRVYVFNSAGSLVLDGFREKTGARMWRFNVHAPHPHTALQASPTHNNYAPHVIHFDNDDENDMPTNLPLTILPQSEAPPPPSMPLTIQPTRVPTTTGSTTRACTNAPPTRSTEYHCRAYDLPSTKNLIEYLHCTVGSLIRSSFLKAVKAGNYRSFPGLSVENVA
jgi:hypothetical protein